jgi:hypothetical protein
LITNISTKVNLELYSCILGLDKEVDAGFARLQQTLTREIQTEKKLLELKAKIVIHIIKKC